MTEPEETTSPTAPSAIGGRHRADAATPASTTDPRDGSRLRTLTFVVLLLWLPAAAAIAVFLLRTPSKPQVSSLTDSTSTAAKAAASTSVQRILSYDYRSVAANVAAAKAVTTGVFATQYAGTASQLLAEAKQEKAIVSATIGSTGVVSSTPNDVVVLLFVDQASVREPKGQKSPTTRIDQSRVQVTMSLVHGKWLVAQLQGL